MRTLCPNCEKTTDFIQMTKKETVEVRGEIIIVDVSLYKCTFCREKFENPSDPDATELAYREYRSRHGMIQPDQIISYRERYGLTQAEFAKLLGWGVATLSRFENGALLSESHDKILKMVQNPTVLLRLIKESTAISSEKKRESLAKQLSNEAVPIFEELYLTTHGNYPPSPFSGNIEFQLSKFYSACLYFAKGSGIWKTKLNKLLFYADFLHFKRHKKSITGSRYACASYGPVPDNYDMLFSLLIERGDLETKEVPTNGDNIGEMFYAAKGVDLSLFSESELTVLKDVETKFAEFTARKITDYSHEEEGYIRTSNGELIPYDYAEKLRV